MSCIRHSQTYASAQSTNWLAHPECAAADRQPALPNRLEIKDISQGIDGRAIRAPEPARTGQNRNSNDSSVTSRRHAPAGRFQATRMPTPRHDHCPRSQASLQNFVPTNGTFATLRQPPHHPRYKPALQLILVAQSFLLHPALALRDTFASESSGTRPRRYGRRRRETAAALPREPAPEIRSTLVSSTIDVIKDAPLGLDTIAARIACQLRIRRQGCQAVARHFQFRGPPG